MKTKILLIGSHRHWKCPEQGCVYLARTREFRVCAAGHLHAHLPNECPAHEVSLLPCAPDEYDARTSVH